VLGHRLAVWPFGMTMCDMNASSNVSMLLSTAANFALIESRSARQRLRVSSGHTEFAIAASSEPEAREIIAMDRRGAETFITCAELLEAEIKSKLFERAILMTAISSLDRITIYLLRIES
jgi:hypothetical protein